MKIWQLAFTFALAIFCGWWLNKKLSPQKPETRASIHSVAGSSRLH